MKGWKWSNGEAVDASDVVFWLNMMKAEPDNYYGYVPGLLPDNLASYSATSPDTVVLHLKSAVSSIWFTYNQLAEITPMPAAWDVTAAGATAGSGGCATDTGRRQVKTKCAAVYKFLSRAGEEREDLRHQPDLGRGGRPVEAVQSFSTASSGPVTSFVPNSSYSGSPKPTLAGFTYYAYTDDTTEYTALKTGQVDVGQVPDQDMSPVSGTQVLPSTNPLGSSYNLQPWYTLRHPVLRDQLQQPDDRPGVQAAVRAPGDAGTRSTRKAWSKTVQRGYAYPTTGARAEPAAEPVDPVGPEVQRRGRARTRSRSRPPPRC